MGEVIELLPKTAVERVETSLNPGTGDNRSRSGTRRFKTAAKPVEKPSPETAPEEAGDQVEDDPTALPEAGQVLSQEEGKADREDRRELEHAVLSVDECVEVFDVRKQTVLMYWKLETMDDWTAPVFGQVCQSILKRPDIRLIGLDLTRVTDMSTLAVATLVRFRNTLLGLDRRLLVAAGTSLHDEWDQSAIARMFDIRANLYSLAAGEIRLIRGRDRESKSFWRRWLPW